MPLSGRIGIITETLRSERDLIFEWKISNAFPRLGIVGDKYRSPFVRFLHAKFHLTVLVRRGDWRYENILLGISRTLWQNRVQCSLCIRKSVNIEEEIVRGRIDSTFQNGFQLTFRNSPAVPPNPFIVICKMWVHERPLVRELLYSESEMRRNVPSSSRAENANLPTAFFNDPELSRFASSRRTEDANLRAAFSNDSEMSRFASSRRAEDANLLAVFFDDPEMSRNDSSRRAEDANLRTGLLYSDSELRRNVASSNRAENANLPTESQSSSSQMSRTTASNVQDERRQSSESLSSSSQMSWTTTSSVSDERRLSSESHSSGSQMSKPTTSVVKKEETELNDGVIISESNTNNEHISNIAMLFVSENIEEIMTTRGWQTFIERFPIFANQLLLKATET